jgi:hypothetical protein
LPHTPKGGIIAIFSAMSLTGKNTPATAGSSSIVSATANITIITWNIPLDECLQSDSFGGTRAGLSLSGDGSIF